MEFVRSIWQDLRSGQNIDSYITILIALFVAILGVAGIVDQRVILSVMLTVLAMVSTSLLVNRQEHEKLRNAISRIENSDYLSDKFFQEYKRSDTHKLVRTSRQAFFWGVTFTRTISLLKDDIETSLENGLEIRILLIKPFSAGVEMAAFRSKDSDVNELNSVLQLNLSKLMAISKKAKSGKLEIRYVNYMPPYTLVCFDPHLINGRMFTRLTTFRVPNQMRPTFELTSKHDKYWFSFFVAQFEAVWKEAEIVK